MTPLGDMVNSKVRLMMRMNVVCSCVFIVFLPSAVLWCRRLNISHNGDQ